MRRREFLTLAALAPVASQAQDSRPNVVVFLVDDMGFADIGPYGAKDIRTPNIDRLASRGVRFFNSYSNGPVCTPTRCALLTGRYQQRYGLEWAILPHQREEGLPSTEPSLPRILKNVGYRTGMFGKWHLGFRPDHGPIAHGFDEYFGILGGNADMRSHSNINGRQDLWEGVDLTRRNGYLTEMLAERAVKFVEGSAGDPFFLYVPFNAVHWPFQPPEEKTARTRETWYDGTRAEYARMVEAVDRAVGDVLDALERSNAANTLIIFTNDNGGERLSRNDPFFHHKATLWEGGVRVPTILSWRGRAPEGQTSMQPMITMDLTATILAATGANASPDRPLEGIDLLPIVSGKSPEVERTFFWRIDREDRKQKAVRRGKHKYVRDGAIEMVFDLDEDPGERHDIAPENPALLASLRQAVAAWEADLARVKPPYLIK